MKTQSYITSIVVMAVIIQQSLFKFLVQYMSIFFEVADLLRELFFYYWVVGTSGMFYTSHQNVKKLIRNVFQRRTERF